MRAAELWPQAAGEPSDTHNHLPALRSAARAAGTVIELGVHGGRSTVALLAGIEDRGDGWLWSLDERAADSLPLYAGKLMGHHPAWTYQQGWSTDPTSLAAAPITARMLFIDTGHTYDLTRDELALWAPKVEPGGTIRLHDTRYPSEPDGSYGVMMAVVSFRVTHTDWDWSEDPAWPGLGTLARPA